MKKFFDSLPWLRIIVGTILLALGVVVMVLALSDKASNLSKSICILAAIYCFIFGLFLVVISLIAEARFKLSTSVIAGGAIIGVGVALCLEEAPDILDFAISSVIPFVLIGAGAALMIESIVLICTKVAPTNWIIAIIAGGIALTVGIIFACNINSGIAGKTLYTILGILIVALGILEIVLGIVYTVKTKRTSVKVVQETKTAKTKKNQIVVK